MIAFDYWHSPRTELLRISAWRIPTRLRVAVAVLCCSSCVIVGAWIIESARLDAAMTLEKRYEQQLEAQGRRLGSSQAYALRVKRMVDLDSRVRAIVSSGILMARRLAALANDLPQNVWLSEVTPQPDGMQIMGRSNNLPAVATALKSLAKDPATGIPAFGSAEIIHNSAGFPPVRFSMKLKYASEPL